MKGWELEIGEADESLYWGSSPLESCTSATHYKHMREILNDPFHGDYDEMQELLGAFFDRESINEELRPSNSLLRS